MEHRYPDDSVNKSLPVQAQARGRTDLWPQFQEWVQLAGATLQERAYERILLELALVGHAAYVQLWPFIVGTLLRSADAREQHDDVHLRAQVQLARLIHFFEIDSNLCMPWISRLYTLIESERTPEALKVVLIEYLGTSQSSTDRLSIVPFLVDRMKHETQAKARACAILALNQVFQYVDTDIFAPARQLIAQMWDGDVDDVVPLDVASKAALALLALNTLKPVPEAAVKHAVLMVADDSEVAVSWACHWGGNSLLKAVVTEVPIDTLVSSDLIEARLREHHGGSGEVDKVPTLRFRDLHAVTFSEVMFDACVRVGTDLIEPVLESLAQASDDEAIERLTRLLLTVLMPEPMIEGTYVEEIDPVLASVLRRLVHESRFDTAWAYWHKNQGEGQWANKGLPGTREALKGFVCREMPAHLVGRKWLPSFEGLDEHDWSGLDEVNLPNLIRGLASRNPRVQQDSLSEIWGHYRHEGPSEEGFLDVWVELTQWVVKLVEYESVPNKDRLLELLANLAMEWPSTYLRAPWKHRDSVRDPIAAELGRHREAFGRLIHEGEDEKTRLAAVALLAVLPKLWRTTIPQLEAVFNDTVGQPIAVRAAALSAMSFVAPVADDDDDDDENCEKPMESEQVRREHVGRVVRLLQLFLAQSGRIKSLKDLVALALARTKGGELTGSDIPEDVKSLLESMGCSFPSSSAFRDLQLRAANGMCRLLLRARGAARCRHTSEMSPQDVLWEDHKLGRWPAGIEQVLIDAIMRPPDAFDGNVKEENWTLLERKDGAMFFLRLFGGPATHNGLAERLLAKLDAMPRTPCVQSLTTEAMAAAEALAYFGLRGRPLVALMHEWGESYDISRWNEYTVRVVSTVVRCDALWWFDGAAQLIRLRQLTGATATPTRDGLAAALAAVERTQQQAHADG